MIAGAIDLHVHSAPDLLPRRYQDIELVSRARDAGMRGLVLKCHYESTVGRAAAVAAATGLEVYGGIVLNRWYSGGVDLETVRASLGLGARIVWMPTVTSAAHRAHYGTAPAGGEDTYDSNLLDAICQQIAAHDAVLASGHLDVHGVEALAEASKRAGARLLVTHPDFDIPDLSVDRQGELAREFPNLWFERCAYVCAAGTPNPRPVERIVAAIRSTGGPVRNVISSDLGQPELPDYPSGLDSFAHALMAEGLSEEEVLAMLIHEPARLLGLPTSPERPGGRSRSDH